MSKSADKSLKSLLRIERKKYLENRKEDGGTNAGFRKRVEKLYDTDKKRFDSLILEALMEAANKSWREKPRQQGPDLFSVAGYTVPEFLTRPAQSEFVFGDDDFEETYEKVDAQYGIVNDLIQDATIHLRKAAQASSAAETQMQAADEALRRAKGNPARRLKDVADKADDKKK